MLLALLLLGCPAEPDPEPFVPDLPTGGCGLAPYDWADMEDMGAIVDWEYVDGYSLEAGQIQGVLEQAGVTAFDPVLYGVRMYRVRYVTQDRGERIEATGWLSFPDVEDPATFPTVLWLHPTMGFNDACAPTAQGLAGAAANLLVSSQGYAVAAPDYVGMAGWGEPSGRLHPWVVPEPTAVASLDALRALWAFSDDRLDPANEAVASRRVVPWGASEGGFAAFWTDRYAAGYLPEAEMVAAVAAVPPTDVVGIAEHGTNTLEAASAGLAALLVANRDWYAGEEPLTDALTAEVATALPEAMTTGCGDGGIFDDVTSLDEVFAPGFLAGASAGAWNDLDPWACYLEQGSLHGSAVARGQDVPVLFIVSGDDDLVVADVERADFERLCDDGYRLDYLECGGASHAEGAALSLPYQLQWLRDRLADEPLPEDLCVRRAPVDCATFGLVE